MGKIEKWRDCPAVGRKIKPLECGQNRGVNYACPSDCPYCPWIPENYDHFSETEGVLDEKTFEHYAELVGQFEGTAKLDTGLLKEGVDGAMEFQSNCYREFHLREYEAGKTMFDLWREAGWPGLGRSDLLFLMPYKARTFCTLIEVRRIVDDLRVECVDLLNEEAGVFTICDRSLAGSALQFQVFVGFIARYPFFWRTHGMAFPLPLAAESGRDFLFRHVRKMGGPELGDNKLRQWLAENFLTLNRSVTDEALTKARSTFRNTDLKECVAVYRLKGSPGDLALAGREEFEPTEPEENVIAQHGDYDAYVWLRAGKSKAWESQLPDLLRNQAAGPGIPIWGNLRVFPNRIEIRGMSEKHFRPMREMAEKFFGKFIVFEKESVVDLAKQTWPEDGSLPREEGGQVAFATSFFPEGVSDPGEMMQQVFRSRYETFLDEKVPALNGLTPREASRRPEMREMLVDLMKSHVQSMDGHSKKDGRTYDIGWVLDELELSELKSAPRIRTVALGSWWSEVDEETAHARMHAHVNAGVTGRLEDLPNVLTFFEDVDEAILSNPELVSLLYAVDAAVSICVPEDAEIEDLDTDALSNESRNVLRLMSGKEPIAAHKALFAGSVQPAILDVAAEVLAAGMKANLARNPPEEDRIRATNLLPMLAHVEAVMRCLRKASLA